MTAQMDGPVLPTSKALGVLFPLALTAVDLDSNTFLSDWQSRSRRHTLPHCIEQLQTSGVLANLRAVADGSRAAHRGMWFSDSDLYKTLEAALWVVATGEDAELRDFVGDAAELLAAAQEPDGYLNSWFEARATDDRWANLAWGHELYCAGHLIQAAVPALRAGREPTLVAVARAFADLIVERFGPDGQDGICGHPEIETALVELYRATGHRPYLDTARKMVDLRGHGLLAVDNRPIGIGDARFSASYFQDHAPVRDAGAATGHAVRQLYLEAGVVDVAVETGNEQLLAASERLWDDLFASKTYVTGAHGSRHRDEAIGDPFELPPDRAYAETCAAIASFQWNWRLLLATGKHRYAEEMERVLHNAVAVATSSDGRRFFYSNPLQLRPGHDGTDEDAPSRRLSWYGCACCPPNLARLLATLNGYVATRDADGVQIQLLTGARIQTAVPGGVTTLHVTSDYPWDGVLKVRVSDTDSAQPWTLSVRIPSWCDGPDVELNGSPFDSAVESGYLSVQRAWVPGDELTIRLPLRARVITAHPHVDAVRGCVALARGPFVYCVEQADLPDGLEIADVRIDPATIADAPPGAVPGVVTALQVDGRFPDRPAVRDLYRVGSADERYPEQVVRLIAVPYFFWGNRDSLAMRVWLPTTAANVSAGNPRPSIGAQ